MLTLRSALLCVDSPAISAALDPDGHRLRVLTPG